MSKEPIFNIVSLHAQDNIINVVLRIDERNEIFEGHFPDQPVVPGACMLQIVKEIMAKTLNNSLRLTKADNIKYLSLVQPATTHELQLQINYHQAEVDIKVTATLMAGDVVCMKLQGAFIES